MTLNLQRHKPQPTPTIRPVPERLATGRLAELYERTTVALGVPWMGVVAMALAHYPTFYDALWSALDDVATTDDYLDACHELLAAAEAEAVLLQPPPISDRLGVLGYDDAEIDAIRQCNAIFHNGNMPYLLMATTARLLLEGTPWPHRKTGARRRLTRATHSRPPLMEDHHASSDHQALYEDMKNTLGLPFINTDYRAFGRWPTYLEAAWADLGPRIGSPAYEPAVDRIHHHAVRLAIQLPNPHRSRTSTAPSRCQRRRFAPRGPGRRSALPMAAPRTRPQRRISTPPAAMSPNSPRTSDSAAETTQAAPWG